MALAITLCSHASQAAAPLPEGWLMRPVTAKHKKFGLILAAANPAKESRLFVWQESSAKTPEEAANSFIAESLGSQCPAQKAESIAPDVEVVTYDNKSGRGGYVIFRKAPNGSVVSFDSDFPPKHSDTVIPEIKKFAYDAF